MRKDTLVALVVLVVLVPLILSLFVDRVISVEHYPGARFFCAGYYGGDYVPLPRGGWARSHSVRRLGGSFRGRGPGGGK